MTSILRSALLMVAVAAVGCMGGEAVEYSSQASGSDDEPELCGGFTDEECDEGEYCHWDASQQCGVDGDPGECRPRPEICIQIYAPVCGCDGVTYANACIANGSGTSVAYDGECRGSGSSPGPSKDLR